MVNNPLPQMLHGEHGKMCIQHLPPLVLSVKLPPQISIYAILWYSTSPCIIVHRCFIFSQVVFPYFPCSYSFPLFSCVFLHVPLFSFIFHWFSINFLCFPMVFQWFFPRRSTDARGARPFFRRLPGPVVETSLGVKELHLELILAPRMNKSHY